MTGSNTHSLQLREKEEKICTLKDTLPLGLLYPESQLTEAETLHMMPLVMKHSPPEEGHLLQATDCASSVIRKRK